MFLAGKRTARISAPPIRPNSARTEKASEKSPVLAFIQPTSIGPKNPPKRLAIPPLKAMAAIACVRGRIAVYITVISGSVMNRKKPLSVKNSIRTQKDCAPRCALT